ncbi:hypothetical protein CRG98_015322 [Punica granatum]|uniref:Uncharacterized protein n=1 Tax=Punica granatum TaxID=22663 RepID=A0A2I0K6X3_PUNGR|nr:hypothetical protein CRG98_015322 [Punica granatum]
MLDGDALVFIVGVVCGERLVRLPFPTCLVTPVDGAPWRIGALEAECVLPWGLCCMLWVMGLCSSEGLTCPGVSLNLDGDAYVGIQWFARSSPSSASKGVPLRLALLPSEYREKDPIRVLREVGMRSRPKEGSRSRVPSGQESACCPGGWLVATAEGGLGPFFGQQYDRAGSPVAGRPGHALFVGAVACIFFGGRTHSVVLVDVLGCAKIRVLDHSLTRLVARGEWGMSFAWEELERARLRKAPVLGEDLAEASILECVRGPPRALFLDLSKAAFAQASF